MSDKIVEWTEPWPACDSAGNTVDAHITHRATVKDCINLQRAIDRKAGRPTTGDEKRRLAEFMNIHLAKQLKGGRGC